MKTTVTKKPENNPKSKYPRLMETDGKAIILMISPTEGTVIKSDNESLGAYKLGRTFDSWIEEPWHVFEDSLTLEND